MLNFVYIVDGDEDVRKSLRAMLGRGPDTIVVTFESGEAFLNGIDERESGVLVLDCYLPELSGGQTLERLGDSAFRFPAIMLVGQGDVISAIWAMKLNAFDCVEKPSGLRALAGIVEAAQARLRLHATTIREGDQSRKLLARLSERESQVLDLLVEGLQNKVVASRLGTSLRTAEAHRANILSKLGAKSLSDALLIAFRGGLMGPSSMKRSEQPGGRAVSKPIAAARVSHGLLAPAFR